MIKEQQVIRVGIAGAAGRGGSFRDAIEALGGRVVAVCDVAQDRLEKIRQDYKADAAYTDFEAMLDKGGLDAVVVATPMQFHASQSIAALQRGIHVLCEVPVAVSVEECRDIVAAAKTSNAIFMMAENYAYFRSNVIIRELVRQGLFGEVFYAEGEYIHDCKNLNEVTKWRRKWQTGINGITYGTHSLGPILQWMPGQRVTRVCCAGGGRRYQDPRGDFYENEVACVMLCKTDRDALIKIRVDLLSTRPGGTHYELQGVDGCYESARGFGSRDKIWLRSLVSHPNEWIDLATLANLDQLADRYLPEIWRNPPEVAKKAGHASGDYFEVHDFFQSVRGQMVCPIGVHESMDMTLPGLISQQSIEQDGAWLDVPDSRTW
jgi:predicted dehydrogenase